MAKHKEKIKIDWKSSRFHDLGGDSGVAFDAELENGNKVIIVLNMLEMIPK